jgi:hypothetical protein
MSKPIIPEKLSKCLMIFYWIQNTHRCSAQDYEGYQATIIKKEIIIKSQQFS